MISDKLRLLAKYLTIGSATFAGAGQNYLLAPDGSTQDSITFQGVKNSQFTTLSVADGTRESVTVTTLRLPANSVTSRSINEGGTVNASGADYAEYMRKSDSCEMIDKGKICGIDGYRELTDSWENTVTFIVISTTLTYVGGDTWSSNIENPSLQPE